MTVIWVVLIVIAALIVLYFLAIMPRLTNREPRKPFLNALYAHRGLHDNASEAPENSMAAFKKAVCRIWDRTGCTAYEGWSSGGIS